MATSLVAIHLLSISLASMRIGVEDVMLVLWRMVSIEIGREFPSTVVALVVGMVWVGHVLLW